MDPNPHNSPHYGADLDCNFCHHQHSKSENFCAQCHYDGDPGLDDFLVDTAES
ncbi:MAG: cytochrome c3 family protein [Deltaproteobacteria bacterium]|nr:cytochrome c3 family protein [Deltaproteobacteria bacterium]